MKINKRLIILLLVIAAFGFIAYKLLLPSFNKKVKTVEDSAIENLTQPVIAGFDRNDSAKFKTLNYQQLLVKWGGSSRSAVNENLVKMIKGGRPAFITVETWPSASDRMLKEGGVLQQIVNGDFDEKIVQLCTLLSKQKNEVLLSVDPEMEVYVNLYPWQMQSPGLYTKAYRHFASTVKKIAPAVKMVWSPAGYPGADEYWPGAGFVDLTTVTLKGKSELMTDNYPEPASQQILFERKIERVRFFDKPVLLLGSEKFTLKDFNQDEFNKASSYIRQNAALVYHDTGIAEKDTPDSVYRKGKPAIGVFDPKLSLASIAGVNTEHIFVNLERLANDSFLQNFNGAISRNHDVIVTMEPWKDKGVEKDPELMANILNGKYDQQFKYLFSIIKNSNGKKVYLRFLHEMEIPITRYPWQSQDPVLYIKAYRYFVNLLQPKPSNISMVWGPAGDRGSMEFWPGSDVVDYVSIAIYGLPDKNISDHKKQESFNTIFKRKYHRISMAHKPLFITEFGVKGPEDYKREWMLAAAATINADSSISGINYFNFADNPKAWGDIKTPDWSTSVSVFTDFIKQLNTSK